MTNDETSFDRSDLAHLHAPSTQYLPPFPPGILPTCLQAALHSSSVQPEKIRILCLTSLRKNEEIENSTTYSLTSIIFFFLVFNSS
ncbi:hypothetical protein HZH68_001751 [Vespula germanica]|uniref:Uncharacterized protein n=1 Tax=Vespula germanica TaxID=30212 RepID=A0A834NW60_VESGE|nr:hypothetical protein HZH68_001751 [Vespula germanica]